MVEGAAGVILAATALSTYALLAASVEAVTVSTPCILPVPLRIKLPEVIETAFVVSAIVRPKLATV